MKIKFNYKQLKKAIKKNPVVVAKESKIFMYRSLNELERKAGSNPWKVGGSGGGVPVLTGNLLRSHKGKIEPFKLTYYQDDRKAKYGKYLHPRRPWLDWTAKQSTRKINKFAETLLKNVVNSLGEK